MFAADTALFLWINATAASPAWVLALARFASLELPQWLLAGTAGAFIVGDSRIRRTVLRLLCAMTLAWLAARLVQHALPAPRPFALGLGSNWLSHGTSAGFPSTHASVAFAYAGMVLVSTRHLAVRIAALALACLIAWSRVCLGLHFPFDVMIGALVGMAAGWAVACLPMASSPRLVPHE